MTDSQPPKPRSRKIYVLWAIALTLLLAAGLFCWLVVVPVWNVHTQLEATIEMRRAKGETVIIGDLKPAVRRLGGPDRAAGLLCLYLRLPDRLVVHRAEAVEALAVCERPRAVPLLIAALDHEDERVRWLAADALGHLAYKGRAAAWPPACKEKALASLTTLLRDKSTPVRAESARAIAIINPKRRSEMIAFLRKQRWRRYSHVNAALSELEEK